MLGTLPWGWMLPGVPALSQDNHLDSTRRLAPRHQGWEEGQNGARLWEHTCTKLGRRIILHLHQELCLCFLWHKPLYIPSRTEVLSTKDLTFPSSWLTCPSLLPWLTFSITASSACVLNNVIPQQACSFSALSVFPGKAKVKASLPGGDQGLPAD